ncbi:MAG: zinc ribbon domain-containing protein [Gammaproteobacteria bacterium]
MPSYDYRCPANGQVIEVKHAMSEVLSTWGEVCEKTGMALNGTPAEAPVEKLITGGGILKGGSVGSEAPCVTGPCCGGGCGHNH